MGALRDCLSSQVLLARGLLFSTCADLAQLLRQALLPLGKIAVVDVISDGQDTIRRVVAQEVPGVPHQLCQFYSVREAALPVFEADRQTKKLLKARELARTDRQHWRKLREQQKRRRRARVQRTRFHRNPAHYLAAIKQLADQLISPSWFFGLFQRT